MRDLLFGTWGAQIMAFCKQQPLQVLAVVLTTGSIVMTLIFGVRGFGSDDTGGPAWATAMAVAAAGIEAAIAGLFPRH